MHIVNLVMYMLLTIYSNLFMNFGRKAMGGITEDVTIMDKIQYKVRSWMIVWDCEER